VHATERALTKAGKRRRKGMGATELEDEMMAHRTDLLQPHPSVADDDLFGELRVIADGSTSLKDEFEVRILRDDEVEDVPLHYETPVRERGTVLPAHLHLTQNGIVRGLAQQLRGTGSCSLFERSAVGFIQA
jgi:hypothetical protein